MHKLNVNEYYPMKFNYSEKYYTLKKSELKFVLVV